MKNSSMHLPLAMLVALCLLPVSAFAHTGVGHATGFAAGFTHPASGVDHLLAIVAVGLWSAQLGGRALWVVPGAFVGMMLAGGILGMSGIPVPFVEQGILVSVLVLGVLIAGAFRVSLLASGILVGGFALFHGLAHGGEMPIATGAVAYSAGFVMATLLLHATGIAAGIGSQRFNAGRMARLAGCAIAVSGVCLVVT